MFGLIFNKVDSLFFEKKLASSQGAHEENNAKFNESMRDHEFTLEHKRSSCPARIHFFANRNVNAGSLNIFKKSLDRLSAKQDLL